MMNVIANDLILVMFVNCEADNLFCYLETCELVNRITKTCEGEMLGQQIISYWKDGPLNQYIDRRLRNAG